MRASDGIRDIRPVLPDHDQVCDHMCAAKLKAVLLWLESRETDLKALATTPSPLSSAQSAQKLLVSHPLIGTEVIQAAIPAGCCN